MTNVAYVISVVGLIVTALLAVWQIRAKRKDEQWARHLARLDAQLSNLYGPLFALFDAGDKEWRAFLRTYGPSPDPKFLGFFPIDPNHPEFPPPNAEQLATFRRWHTSAFMPTNTRMADLMIANPALLLGTQMPQCFLDFCVHVTALRAAAARWTEPDFNPADYRQHIAIFPHPAADLHRYLKASFEILKQEQSRLLSREVDVVDERSLTSRIAERIRGLERAS